MKICLDPGHVKGYNAGYDKAYREGTAMFTLAEKLKTALQRYAGVEVFLTRGLNDNPSLEARGKLARSLKCDLLISLHSNAYKSTTACGVSTFYSVKRESKALAKKLAEAVAAEMAKDTGVTYSRGAKTRTYVGAGDGKTYDYYGIIRNTVVGSTVKHAVIVEHGFHTNPAECRWLMQDKYLDRLAATDAAVIADFCGLTAKGEPAKAAAPAPVEPIKIGDRVRVIGTKFWKSGVLMAPWVAAGCVFEVMRLKDDGLSAVIGRKIAGKLAVTGTIGTEYLQRV